MGSIVLLITVPAAVQVKIVASIVMHHIVHNCVRAQGADKGVLGIHVPVDAALRCRTVTIAAKIVPEKPVPNIVMETTAARTA